MPDILVKMDTKTIGDLGESLACVYLTKHGFTIIYRNYRKNWGELDIIALKSGCIHFIEVKTVSYETKEELEASVSYGTWRPEERVHKQKLKKLHRAIQSWLTENTWEGNWQIDVVGVRVVPRETYLTINLISNVVF